MVEVRIIWFQDAVPIKSKVKSSKAKQSTSTCNL